ncbi:hypothetical protein MXB_4163 [Myxobolus squamalis]|nr:hypothetical protein MXB_4163 [Myxobolus squamalis]
MYFDNRGIDAYFYSALEITKESDNEKCSLLTNRKALIEIFHRFKASRKLSEKITVGFVKNLRL